MILRNNRFRTKTWFSCLLLSDVWPILLYKSLLLQNSFSCHSGTVFQVIRFIAKLLFKLNHKDQETYAMSSNWIICLFIFGFVYSAYSAQFVTKPYQHPGEYDQTIWKVYYTILITFVQDYPGQCYDEETNKPVPVGESINNSKLCKWQMCHPDFSFTGST